MQEWLVTMRSALLVSAVCILLYILGKRMSAAMRKSETKTSFALVNEFESSIQDGTLTVAFHVPINFHSSIEIVVKSARGDVLATLQDGPCERGRQIRSCSTIGWSGRCTLLLKSESQSLERYLRLD